ncbi:MAG: YggS family pyridoxal phosphate-dependent enzyme [Calditrichaeota bacterium]|nr:MAG: YggS family pyridoxal phosphate-dependent enzyme [Calditrichota bacterium]
MTISENLSRCLERIDKAAAKSGRNLSDITLVAVTKTVEPERMNEGIKAGITIIGENKVQEAVAKKPKVIPVAWHMVGHLQRNKVKQAVELFNMIQSVDSVRLAKEIDKRCGNINKVMPVLVEVNTSGEDSKYGCPPETTGELIGKICELSHLKIEGLMTIGLFTDDMELVRPCFVKLRKLAEQLKSLKIPRTDFKILSMGMSADFETAIEEGSNMVRIGTAIFGPRKYGD